jgi:nucleoid-associated protein YgaU
VVAEIRATGDQLTDPAKIKPGQVLEIPAHAHR